MPRRAVPRLPFLSMPHPVMTYPANPNLPCPTTPVPTYPILSLPRLPILSTPLLAVSNQACPNLLLLPVNNFKKTPTHATAILGIRAAFTDPYLHPHPH